ncbi:ankyrin repeat domain-containing protein 42-like [Actinia tenebrosa]|uniref:Ankyrin repeat domain-containing protein 42-like n=1 Tax=Actinia tenebrosa TaxID=6105 RepID=A0A6P8IJ68_ACTTE|nr:ankyrin repeat domain-containing protein 42-like [Actinia tenebrosa]
MPDKVHLSSIHEAARYGDVLELQAMVQRGAGINALDTKFKFTPLHWTALHGRLECLHWLLWHGADHSDRTPQGWTPSHLAAIRGQDACIQSLAANGADLNAKDNRGCTPAHLAASHGNSYTLQSILRHGVDVNATDNMGWTAVHCAAFHGRLGCLQLLARWGASLDEVDNAGSIPAHLAASEGHLPCLKFLVCSGTSIDHTLNARNDQGETPKNLCQQFYKNECMEYLKAVEYDLLHPEDEENLAFPAHVAAYNGDLPQLKMLIETGVVSINERDSKGSTPAHKAAGNGHVQVLQWLVENGANMRIVNSAGETPKDVARRFGRLGCLAILGGDSDNEDNNVMDGGAEDIQPEEPQSKAEARGRAMRKIEELRHLLDVAKMNYKQLGGVLDEDQKKLEEERESARIIRELEAQLEYEREKREKLEAQMDRLRAQIHTLTLQLEDERSLYRTVSETKKSTQPTQQSMLRRKKKKSKRIDTSSSGVFVRRGVSSPNPIHCQDKD